MVCRSLFEKDKLLFSFLLCTRTMRADSHLSDNELKFLITGKFQDPVYGTCVAANSVYHSK